MILEETINRLLRDSIDLILSTPNYTIAGEQKDAPRPIGAYADVNFISDIGLGWEHRRYEDRTFPDLDIDEKITGLREIMMSVSFYRDDAIDKARKVRTGFTRESIQTLFRAASLGLTTRSEVRKISEPLESGWEERAQFDIVLNATGTDEDIIRSIQSVDMAAEFQYRGLTYNFNIQVQ